MQRCALGGTVSYMLIERKHATRNLLRTMYTVVSLTAALNQVGHLGGTALHAAARVGYVRIVAALLAAGARDMRDKRQRTALHIAAKHGHDSVVAMLLDRGADHFAVDASGMRAIDWAAKRRHPHTLRLMEMRVCPFRGPLLIEQQDWTRRSRLHELWVVVHRARPWDNPAVNRADVSLCMYGGANSVVPSYVLIRPELRPLSTDTDGDVVFEISAAMGRGKRTTASQRFTLRARAPRILFSWLAAVLSDGFATGHGPGFDDDGDVYSPPQAHPTLAAFSTGELPVPSFGGSLPGCAKWRRDWDD